MGGFARLRNSGEARDGPEVTRCVATRSRITTNTQGPRELLEDGENPPRTRFRRCPNFPNFS